MSRRTSPNGCFGIKAHYKHLDRLIRVVGPQQLVGEYKFILLRRRELLSQAVSLAFSRQTRSWISGMPQPKSARYNAALIDDSLQSISSDNANWEDFLGRLALPTCHVVYEELQADPERELRRIASFVDVAYDDRAYHDQKFMPRPENSADKRDWASIFSQTARTSFIEGRYRGKRRLLQRFIFKSGVRRGS